MSVFHPYYESTLLKLIASWVQFSMSIKPILPSILLSRRFYGIVSLAFSEFWHGARNTYEVVRDRTKKFFLPQNLGKWTRNGSKTGFFEFIERFGH